MPGNYYLVHGNPSLSDAHDRYLVQLDTDTPTCSCQSHEHGQYRPVCSHGVAALLHAEEHGVELSPIPAPEPTPQSIPQAGEADPPAAASPGLPPAVPQGSATVDTPPGVLPHPGDRAWGQPGLPDWVASIPPHQERAVLEIEDAFDRGAKVVVLSAPTGTGKTLLGELTRRRLNTPAVYSATTKTLQSQVLEDFDYARILQGRSNYACVTAETPVLTSDLRWVPAGDLHEGDELYALDEHRPAYGHPRHYRHSVVLSNKVEVRDVVRVVLETGEELICTPDHPWLSVNKTSGEVNRTAEWRQANSGNLGYLPRYMDVWEAENTFEAGWLSGMLDGEGCYSTQDRSESGRLGFWQKAGPAYDRFVLGMKERGFELCEQPERDTGVKGANLAGGHSERLKLLGVIRPERLIPKMSFPALYCKEYVKVVRVEPAGRQPVALLGTSTKTFFAAGFAAHNTQLFPERFTDSSWNLSCEDCNWTKAKPSCTWCESKAQCPYEQAKEEALAAQLAVVNTAYFLAECNGPGKLRSRGLAILDEADMLESQLMGHAEVRVGKKWQERLGIEPPGVVTHTAKSAIPTWRQWAEEARQVATNERSKYTDHDEDPKAIRERRFLDSLRQGLTMLERGLSDDESPKWVYTDPGDGTIVFRPVRVSQLGEGVLWGHADRFLLMSASVISADEMMDSLGFTGHWEHVEVPSTFNPARRPVYACPVADVTSKGYDTAVPQLQQSLARIAAHHPAENILVHSVSYKLARDLAATESIPHEVISYASAKGRNKALDRFRKAGRPAMIVAPSLDRGVDLPDDACRVVVVAKVPYPYLGDRQVHARLYSPGGQTWYRVQTVRSIVQMTGRAMRHKDDSSVSYILDRQFMNLWRKAGHLFPGWWTEAMRWEYPSFLGGG